MGGGVLVWDGTRRAEPGRSVPLGREIQPRWNIPSNMYYLLGKSRLAPSPSGCGRDYCDGVATDPSTLTTIWQLSFLRVPST